MSATTSIIRPALDELPAEAATLWLRSKQSVIRGVTTWLAKRPSPRPRDLLILIVDQRSELAQVIMGSSALDIDVGDQPAAPLVVVLGPDQARVLRGEMKVVQGRVATLRAHQVPVLIYPQHASAGLCVLTVAGRGELN